MTLRQKTLLYLSLCLLLPALVLMGGISLFISPKIKKQAEIQLRTQANLQTKRIQSAVDDSFKQLALVSSRTQMRISFAEYQKSNSPKAFRRIKKILGDALKSVEGIQQVNLYDKEGELLVSVPEGLSPKNFRTKVVQQKHSPSNQHFLGIAKRNEKIGIHLSSKLFLNDDWIGTIQVEFGGKVFEDIALDYTGLGKTGETILLYQDDRTWKYLSSLRFLKDQVLSELPSSTDKRVLQSLVGQENEFFLAKDYRNTYSMYYKAKIPEMSLALLLKIDEHEVLGDIRLAEELLWVFLLLMSLVSFFVIIKLTKPILVLAEVAKNISKGDYSTKIEVTSKDEFSSLAVSLNSITQRMQASTEYIKSLNGKIRGLLNQVTDNLFEPLNEIEEISKSIEMEQDPTSVKEQVKRIHGLSKFSKDKITEVLELIAFDSQYLDFDFEKISLTEIKEALEKNFQRELSEKKLKLTFDIPTDTSIRVDHYRFLHALSILVKNSIDYSTDGQEILINYNRSGLKPKIEIVDEAPMLAQNLVPYLFDKVAPIKRNGENLEVSSIYSLSFANEIMKAHGTNINCISKGTKGCVFEIPIPMKSVVD